VNFRTDVASGAPIKNAIQAWVTATFQARNTNTTANAGHGETCEGFSAGAAMSGTSNGSGVPNDAAISAAGDAPEVWAMPANDRRTVAQLQADALTAICEHITECDNNGLPLTGATVIV